MLPVHTILFATDLTDDSQAVFEFACSLARDHGARLVVLHVEMPPVVESMAIMTHDPETYYARAWEELRGFQSPESNIRVEHLLAVGDPATEILRVAENTSSGLIVMGTHGRSGLARVLLGSVAEAVLRRAQCPVLTVRCPSQVGTGEPLACRKR